MTTMSESTPKRDPWSQEHQAYLDELDRQAALQQMREERHKLLGILLATVATGKLVRPVSQNVGRNVDTATDHISQEDPASEVLAQQAEGARERQVVLREMSASTHQQQNIIEYMAVPAKGGPKGQGAYSFVKNIPHVSELTTGYQELAADTLAGAVASQRRQDGSVALLGSDVRQQHAQHAIEARAVSGLAASEAAYNGGVATSLWQLGFIKETYGEDTVRHGDAVFNPDIVWSQANEDNSDGPITTHYAQIPFDASNQLHTMLVPDGVQHSSGLAVELEFSQGVTSHYGQTIDGEFMNLRVVPAVAQQ